MVKTLEVGWEADARLNFRGKELTTRSINSIVGDRLLPFDEGLWRKLYTHDERKGGRHVYIGRLGTSQLMGQLTTEPLA